MVDGRAWQGFMYVQDGVIKLGAVTRETGTGQWQAWRFPNDKANELLGDYATVEDAQRAVEKALQILEPNA